MTTETAAETMRRAARLMRERAEAATPGPWIQDDDYPGDVATEQESVVTGAYAADTPHIAGMHPGVAVAVADWLDEAAGDWVDDSALKVASVYLGEVMAG